MLKFSEVNMLGKWVILVLLSNFWFSGTHKTCWYRLIPFRGYKERNFWTYGLQMTKFIR